MFIIQNAKNTNYRMYDYPIRKAINIIILLIIKIDNL
jgi:hypothetical protein